MNKYIASWWYKHWKYWSMSSLVKTTKNKNFVSIAISIQTKVLLKYQISKKMIISQWSLSFYKYEHYFPKSLFYGFIHESFEFPVQFFLVTIPKPLTKLLTIFPKSPSKVFDRVLYMPLYQKLYDPELLMKYQLWYQH